MTVGIARPAPAFLRGFDCLSPLANNTARQFKADGYDFVSRYLENLTATERDGIFSAGLAILLLTEATTSVTLDAPLGRLRGSSSVRRASALEAPSSLSVVIDLESCKGDAGTVAEFTDAFHDELVAGLQDSMVYVGADQPLDAIQLYLLKTHHYMRAGSFQIPEPRVGWCCIQLSPLDRTVHGQRVDFEIIQSDALGRTPTLWWPT